MSVRFEDLPEAMRARVRAEHPDAAPTRRPKGRGIAGGRWRCGTCGLETEGVFSRAEDHADREGHRRIECVLTPV